MDRLKKEWRETQIPPETRLWARNRAWEKMHRPFFRTGIAAPAFAACAIALAALFVRFPDVPDALVEPPAHSDQRAAAAGQQENGSACEDVNNPCDDFKSSYEPVKTTGLQMSADILPADSYEDTGMSVERAGTMPALQEMPEDFTIMPENESIIFNTASSETVSLENNDEPNRVVFNFILPKSGARLVWLASSNN